MTREHFGLGPYGPASLAAGGATVKGCVGFLRSWLLRIAEEADYPVDDLAREARDCRWALERLDPAHETEDRAKLKCPGDHPEGDGRLCHGRILFDREHPSADIGCHRCGTTWNGARLLLLALHDETQVIWMYPAEILVVTGIPKRTLQRWGQDGTVKRNGTMYDVGGAFRSRLRLTG